MGELPWLVGARVGALVPSALARRSPESDEADRSDPSWGGEPGAGHQHQERWEHSTGSRAGPLKSMGFPEENHRFGTNIYENPWVFPRDQEILGWFTTVQGLDALDFDCFEE